MPPRNNMIDVDVQRNPAVSDDIVNGFFDEFGKITDRAVAMFQKRKTQRSPIEQQLVRELAIVIWRGQASKSIAKFARIVGLERPKAEATIREAIEPLEVLPEARQMSADHEKALEEMRYQSHAQLIKTLLDGQQRFLLHALNNMGEMSGSEALRGHDICLKNAELLSGRATSRSARSDDRSKSTEDLEKEVLEGQKKISRFDLKVVDGSGQ